MTPGLWYEFKLASYVLECNGVRTTHGPSILTGKVVSFDGDEFVVSAVDPVGPANYIFTTEQVRKYKEIPVA